MILFLIVLIVFVIVLAVEKGSFKNKEKEYIASQQSNCRLQYEIGCKIFNDCLKIYAQHASIWEAYNFDSFEEISVRRVVGLVQVSFEETREYIMAHKDEILDNLLDVSENGFDKWVLSNQYRDGDIFYKTLDLYREQNGNIHRDVVHGIDVDYCSAKEAFQYNYSQAVKCLSNPKLTATSLRDAKGIAAVAKHYGLPTESELKIAGDFGYSTLDSVITKYAEREIKKLGYSLGKYLPGRFTPNPTEEDFKEAEECDTNHVRWKREQPKREEIKNKYPWL